MLRTKKDVDAHVRDIFSKLPTEQERSLRCFSIARSYSGIREFETAARYLEMYIKQHSHPEKLGDAYKLMGDILHDMKDNEGALENYKKSYDLSKSRIPLNRVCDLLHYGHGKTETNESRKRWFELQKVAASSSFTNFQPTPKSEPGFVRSLHETEGLLTHSPLSAIHTPASRGDSKTRLFQNGSNGHDSNKNNNPSEYTMTSSPKQLNRTLVHPSPERMDVQMKYLERRLDNVLSQIVDQNNKLMDQNSQLINTVTLMGDEIKDLRHTVSALQSPAGSPYPTHDSRIISTPPNGKETESLTLPSTQLFRQEAAWTKPETLVPAQPVFKPIPSVSTGLSFSSITITSAGSGAGFKSTPTSTLSTTSAPPPTQKSTTTAGGKMVLAPATFKPSLLNSTEVAVSIPVQTGKDAKTSSTKDTAPVNIFSFSNTAPAKLPGFGDLATQNKDSGFSFGGTKPSTSLSFASQSGSPATPLFGGPSVIAKKPETRTQKEDRVDGDGHEEGAEEFVPTAEFTPVIPLPPLVDVKKGDEDENLIYEVRAKLFRFVDETQEWKERGVGNIKLLQDKKQAGKVRVVMWREQIHKLACNHSLLPDSTINFMQNKRNTLIWGAMDFAEGKPKKEMFTCRFGKEEQCAEFKAQFEKLVAEVASAGPGESSPEVANPESTEVSTQPQVPLSDLFKKAEGSWTCSGCYMDNAREALRCPSCSTAQPGVTDTESEPPSLTPASLPKFSFGFGTTAPLTAETLEKPSSFGTFSFSAPVPAPVQPDPAQVSLFSFSDSAPAKMPGFGDLATQNKDSGFAFGSAKSTTALSFGSKFGSLAAPLFGASVTDKKPDTSAQKEGRAEGDGHEESVEEFVPTAEFTPVIPLPPLVEVKKGDEHENLIYEVRAKLYRFVEETQEWKERGLGNIKLLQDKKQKGKVRVVMWREQIHKLACNHNLLADSTINFMQNKRNTLIWGAMDFAEGEPKKEMFTCRFGKEEACAEFKVHFEKLVSEVASFGPGESCPTVTTTPESTEASTQPQVPLSDLFKKAEGSWTCTGCYMDNVKEALKCPSCATAQPGVTVTEPDPPSVMPAPAPLFGFGFGTPAPPKAETDKSNSFGTFSFSAPVPAAVQPATTTSTVAPAPFSSFSFSNSAPAKMPGFGDLATQNKDSGFAFGAVKPTTALSFGSLATPLFSTSLTATKPDTSTQKEDREVGDGHEEGAEEFVPTAEFTPVIPLPPIVEVKKGDEDENTIYEVRAKLYRFVEETQEWKERGLGNIKLLQDKKQKGKVRVVMWREQIHKLACNHSLLPDSTINFMQNKKNILIWGAMDFAEGEPKKEMFTCRFGKEEVCAEFKAQFEKLVAEVASAGPEESSPEVANPESTEVSTQPQVPLSDLFKKAEGSWTCSGCYMDNTREALRCPSCSAAQPGVPDTESEPASLTPASLPKFSFGFGTTTPQTAETQEKPSSFGTFSFSAPVPAPVQPDPAQVSLFSFSDSAPAKMPGFGDLATQNKDSGFAFGSAKSTTALSFGSKFGSLAAPLFGASVTDKKLDTSAQKEGRAEADGHEESVEEFVPTAEFTPVIPLPPLVEVKKGDEHENLIYEVRAKLYRFVEETQEWKERGLGNIKLLQDKNQKGKVRVVMWREQIHKLACNHNLLADSTINFMQNKRNTLIWGAMDFAEGEPKKEMFTCRFGKEETCAEFKSHFEKLVAEIATFGPGESSPKVSAPESTEVSVSTQAQVPLSDLFKKAEGSWTCSGCYMDNAKETLTCPSCATAQPGVAVTESDTASLTSSAILPKFNFGFGATNPVKVGTEESNTFATFSFTSPVPATVQHVEGAHESECDGCIGCDPDSFDFGKLDSRQVPSYPDQSLNPEEYAAHMLSQMAAQAPTTPDTHYPIPQPTPVPTSMPPFAMSSSPLSFNFVSSLANFQHQSQSPTASAPQPLLNTSSSAVAATAEEEEDEDDDDYEDDEDEAPMFEGPATLSVRYPGNPEYEDLGEGIVSVTYDNELYCSRFHFLSDAEQVLSHVIAADTHLQSIGDLSFAWTGLSESDDGNYVRLELQATFPSADLYALFLDRVSDSQEIAGQAGVTEEYLVSPEEEYEDEQ